MISKGKRRYLVWLYWSLTSPYAKMVVGKHRIIKETSTKGYYDGVKRLDTECDLEVFYGIEVLGPNAKTITISRSEISGIDKGQPKFESVDLTEVLNDFNSAREKTL